MKLLTLDFARKLTDRLAQYVDGRLFAATGYLRPRKTEENLMDWSHLFQGNRDLRIADLRDLDVANFMDAEEYLFHCGDSFQSIGEASFSMPLVVDMFNGCTNLEEIYFPEDLPGFPVAQAYMYKENGEWKQDENANTESYMHFSNGASHVKRIHCNLKTALILDYFRNLLFHNEDGSIPELCVYGYEGDSWAKEFT